jgi:chromosome segregation ATPase
MTTAIPAIDEATKTLSLANAALGELNRKRDALLLDGKMNEVAEVDADIDRATAHAKRCEDRVTLLEREAKRNERKRQEKELRDLVGRLETKLAKRDQLAAEFEKQLAAAVATFHALHEVGTEGGLE